LAFYKRSIFLVDPKFQIKFSIAVCVLIFISSLIYPLLLWDFLTQISNVSPELAKKIISTKNEFFLYLLLIQLIFITLVFIISIFLTHKIAGPLYKLKKHLLGIRQGDPVTPLVFRGGDHFSDVADEVSLFLETLTLHHEQDFQYLNEVSQFIKNLSAVIPDDKKPVLEEIEHRLKDIQFRYRK